MLDETNMQSLLISICVLLIFLGCACKFGDRHSFTIRIDPSIKDQVLSKEYKLQKDSKNIDADYGYFNDSLRLVIDPNDDAMHPVFFWLNFNRKENRQFLYCCGHTGPRFKINDNDKPQQCIEVPFESGKLILSSMPDTNSKEPIYGYIQYKSDNFYYVNDASSEKLRGELKQYFVARFRR